MSQIICACFLSLSLSLGLIRFWHIYRYMNVLNQGLILGDGALQKLRSELDKLLKRKIEEPGLDISAEGKGVVAAVVELLHSQNV